MVVPQIVRLVLTVFIIVASFSLSFLVFKYGKDRLTSACFIFLNLSSIVWVVSTFFALSPTYFFVIFFPRLCMVGSVGINIGILLMSHALIVGRLPLRKILLLVLAGISFLPLIFSDFIFREVDNGSLGLVILPGPGMTVFAIFTFITFSWAIHILYYGIKLSPSVTKQKQVRWMLTGMVGMCGAFILTVMLPIIFFNNAIGVQFGGFYIMFFLICTTVAILKYRLFDTQIIITEFLIGFLDLFLFIQLLLSKNLLGLIFSAAIFLIALILSFFLIRAGRREIQARENLARAEGVVGLNKELAELDRQKTEFLNIAAHQLRTPVSVIKNYIAMLQDGDYGKVSESVQEVHKNIGESSEWLVRLADEFLNIAHLEQGRTNYRTTESDVGLLVGSVVKELSLRAENKGLQLVWNRPKLSLHAHVDEEKMRNVIFNFVDNAIKYAAHGNIYILAAQENDGVVVRVQDEGVGFDSDDEGKLFKKFTRGRNAHQIEVNTSTGLGLYIARMFVEGHGGRVWAHSEGLGKGSEFGFWVPMK